MICNKCGKKLDPFDEYGDFTLHRNLGYGSIYDGSVLDLHLCCECMDSIINSCTVCPVKNVISVPVKKFTKAKAADSLLTMDSDIDNAIYRKVAAAIWNGEYGWGEGRVRRKRLREVFGERGTDVQALVDAGIGAKDPPPDVRYTYWNMQDRRDGVNGYERIRNRILLRYITAHLTGK